MKALVLSGGGSKGAYQVGVLKKWLQDDGLDYDILTGISVGAINAAHICQTPKGHPKLTWEALNNVWLQVTTSKVRKSWFPFGVIEAFWKPSVYNSAPLQSWIRKGLDAEKIRASGRKLRIVAVSWDSGESYVADETDPDLVSWVIASSAFPVMLTSIQIGGQLWTDGGLRSTTPLGEAIRAGATDIDVILTENPELPDPYRSKGRSALELAPRGLEVLANQILRADLKICGLKNDLVGPYRKVNLRVAMPRVNLSDVSDSLEFTQKTIQRMIAMGYADACSGF